jgi:hypothetical protein
MMVDGAEEGQLRGPIDVLAPYTRANPSPCRCAASPIPGAFSVKRAAGCEPCNGPSRAHPRSGRREPRRGLC